MPPKKRTASRRGEPIIRASEIGAYVYCRRAWWLKRFGGYDHSAAVQNSFQRGDRAHAQHNRQAAFAYYLQRGALWFFIVAALLFGAATVWHHFS